MLPVIKSFMAAHGLPDVTVVADAGMVPEANQKDIEAAGLSFILGMKIPHVPWSISRFVKTARRYRIILIQAGGHVITDADPIPVQLRQALEAINTSR